MNPVTIGVIVVVGLLLLNRQGSGITAQSPLARGGSRIVPGSGQGTQAGQTTQTLGIIAGISSIFKTAFGGQTNSGFQSPSNQVVDVTSMVEQPSVISTQSIGIGGPDVSPNLQIDSPVGLSVPGLFPDATGIPQNIDLQSPTDTISTGFDPSTFNIV